MARPKKKRKYTKRSEFWGKEAEAPKAKRGRPKKVEEKPKRKYTRKAKPASGDVSIGSISHIPEPTKRDVRFAEETLGKVQPHWHAALRALLLGTPTEELTPFTHITIKGERFVMNTRAVAHLLNIHKLDIKSLEDGEGDEDEDEEYDE